MMNKALDTNVNFQQFIDTTKAFLDYKRKNIPLCAAENVMSPFAKSALLTSAQEKYVMGGVLAYIEDDNFIGGDLIYPYYKIIDNQCNVLFNSAYADARTLTGMNAITTLLMSLLEAGDTIAYAAPDCGGHASIPDICRRLGLQSRRIPYDYGAMDFDYEETNQMIEQEDIDAMLICISDIVNLPQFNKLSKKKNLPIIYDATQTLGLIAGGAVCNPFIYFEPDDPFILMGATHKTIPGPSCALIMTQNLALAQKIEKKINPTFIRNTQMHQKMSLILTLLEMEYFGKEYSRAIIDNAQTLARILAQKGFHVLNRQNGYTQTHQIHITCSPEQMYSFYDNCTYYNVTLNFKTKKLFNNAGIRLGTQEISRYGWDKDVLQTLGALLDIFMKNPCVYKLKGQARTVQSMIESLIDKKEIHFTFAENEYSNILKGLFTY